MPEHSDPRLLTTIPAGDGEHFDVAGAKLTWKVKAKDTEMRFCFFEQVLAPGEVVPLHSHHYTETFYVLAGNVTFFSEQSDRQAYRASVGDVVVARPPGLHGFANEGDIEARLLSISVPEHQLFFDAMVAADREQPFAVLSSKEVMMRVAAIGYETDSVFDQA